MKKKGRKMRSKRRRQRKKTSKKKETKANQNSGNVAHPELVVFAGRALLDERSEIRGNVAVVRKLH